jgi:short-subunit dehydrogenase
MADEIRRTALITGASAGIGTCLAEVFAQHGFDLVLTARREERLRAIADDLAARYGIRTRIIAADLAQPGAVARICDELAVAKLHVDVLVNNAGYGVPGSYRTTTWAQQGDFVQVMVTAVCEMTHRLLPGMVERGYGRIVNIASVAGLLPPPAGHTLYGASKAFMIKFTQALALETRKYGVHATAVCPGFTYSEFHDVIGTREHVSRLPSWMWFTADQVAREAYDAVMRGDMVHVVGWVYRAILVLTKILPERLVTAVVRGNASKFRKTEP